MRSLVLLALLLVLAPVAPRATAGPSPAPSSGTIDDIAAKAPTLGPAPIKCFPGGCYGSDVGPNYMDNTSVGELDLAPHIVQADQEITANVTWGWPSDFCNVYDPEGTTSELRHTCTFKLGASSETTWGRLGANFCSFGCGVEQDFYYVVPSDKTAITGMVRNADGSGVKGARIDIKGPRSYFAITQEGGFYQAVNIPKGKYTVTGPANFCAVNPLQRLDGGTAAATCPASLSVDITNRTGAVDFDEEAYTVSGIVVQQTCSESTCTRTPLGGIPIGAKTAKRTTGTSTAGDGTYSLRLGAATWEIGPTSTDRVFEPKKVRVIVNRAPRDGVDFIQCAIADKPARTVGPEQAAGTPAKCPAKLRVFTVDKATPPNPVKSGLNVTVEGPSKVTKPVDTYYDFTHFLLKPGEYAVSLKNTDLNALGLTRYIYCLGNSAKKMLRPCVTGKKVKIEEKATEPVDVNFVRTTICDASGYRPLPNDPPPAAGDAIAGTPAALDAASVPKPGERRLFTRGNAPLGATLHGSGQPIVAKLGKVTAALDSTLWIISPYVRKVDINDNDGHTVKLPAVKNGQEIVLQLCVHDTILKQNFVFTSGPGSRNDDTLPHAKMKEFGKSVVVSFEDTPEYSTPGHPDRDFDEFVVTFTGVGFDGKVNGRVRKLNDKGEFVPAGGVKVTLGGGDKPLAATTKPDGTYAFKELEEGDYVVSVPKGYCAEPFSAQNKKHADCKETKAISLDDAHPSARADFEQESYELRVRVIDRTERDFKHAGVIVRASGVGSTKSLPDATTDESGQHDYKRVPAGIYSFFLRFPRGDFEDVRICLNPNPTREKCEVNQQFVVQEDMTIEATAMTLGRIVIQFEPLDGNQLDIRTGLGRSPQRFWNFYTPTRTCHSGCASFQLKVDVKNGLRDDLKGKVKLDLASVAPGGFKAVKGGGQPRLCVLTVTYKVVKCSNTLVVETEAPATYRVELWPASLGLAGGESASDAEVKVRVRQKGFLPAKPKDAQVSVRPGVLVDESIALGADDAEFLAALGDALNKPSTTTTRVFCEKVLKLLGLGLFEGLAERHPWVKKAINFVKGGCKALELPEIALKWLMAYEMMGTILPGKTQGLGLIDLTAWPPDFGSLHSDFFDAMLDTVEELARTHDGLGLKSGSLVRFRIIEASRPDSGENLAPGNLDQQPTLVMAVTVRGQAVLERTVTDGYLPRDWLPLVWDDRPQGSESLSVAR